MKWQKVDFASAKTKRSKYSARPGNQATPPTRAELTKKNVSMKTSKQSIIIVAFAAKCWRNSIGMTC